ncbi:MAG: AAA family ATPase [Gemmatimonadota bacterium]|nr:AAA family ATPase [Gemmatimonadota bacterium]
MWEQARHAAERSSRGAVLVLDEIQDIPDWSRTVKGLWDQDQATGCPLRVVVMGSAPFQLMVGPGERLVGRFLPFPVGHWSLAEMVRAFDCSMDQYLFLLGQLQGVGNTTTLARYLTLLSGAGLLAGLGNYSPNTHRRRASSPKLNVLNMALMTASSGIRSRRRGLTAPSGAGSWRAQWAPISTIPVHRE